MVNTSWSRKSHFPRLKSGLNCNCVFHINQFHFYLALDCVVIRNPYNMLYHLMVAEVASAVMAISPINVYFGIASNVLSVVVFFFGTNREGKEDEINSSIKYKIH